MGLFDLFNDVKESADRSRQAREYIQRAKELVREGDQLYERAYDKVTSYASETEYRIRKHMNYKRDIAKELGGNIGVTLKEFRNFNIDTKIIEAPSIQDSTAGLDIFKSSMSSCMPNISIPSILDMFISDDDYYEAKRQRDEAKAYKERMKREREKLESYKEKMSEIRSFMDAEKNELDTLMSKLRRMTDDLNKGMQKGSYSSQEAEYLKGVHKIAECVAKLLSTEFLSDGFSVNQRYAKAFEGIKQINQSLPYFPSISDSNTLGAIKKILDSTVVY